MAGLFDSDRPNASRLELVAFAAALLVLGVALWRLWDLPIAAAVAGGVGAAGLLAAALGSRHWAMFYDGWQRTFAPLRWLISTLVLASVYFFIVTPTGLVRRALGASPVSVKPDDTLTTYWIASSARDQAPEDFLRPY